MAAAKFVPEYSNEDKAVCYENTGGVAKYLSMIDPRKSIDENITRLFFRMDVNTIRVYMTKLILLEPGFCCFATLTDTQ